MTLSQVVREHLDRTGWTARMLAAGLGLSHQTVYNWVNYSGKHGGRVGEQSLVALITAAYGSGNRQVAAFASDALRALYPTLPLPQRGRKSRV